MRLYTRGGDGGETGLLGGARVRKDDPRVEVLGAVDELNAIIGLARAFDAGAVVDAVLAEVQSDLLRLGADLAAPTEGTHAGRLALPPGVGAERVSALEADIDRFVAALPPLQHFVHPGGSPAGAALHLARTVCRRAERRVVALGASHPVDPQTVAYLNRLSDLLFVLARAANQATGRAEVPWVPQRSPEGAR